MRIDKFSLKKSKLTTHMHNQNIMNLSIRIPKYKSVDVKNESMSKIGSNSNMDKNKNNGFSPLTPEPVYGKIYWNGEKWIIWSELMEYLPPHIPLYYFVTS